MLTEIFGEYPRVKILDAFTDNFDEELSIEDLLWLTDLQDNVLIDCINNLLNEEYILKNNQLYHLNTEKIEVKIFLGAINFLVCYKLGEELKERGLREYDINYEEKKLE